MIVPMKKIFVFVQSKDASSATLHLRKLGAVHIEHQQVPHGQEIQGLNDDILSVNSVLAILSSPEFSKVCSPGKPKFDQDWRFLVKHIIDLNNRLEQLEEYSHHLKNRITQWQLWGDFDPEEIKLLSNSGIFVSLYQIPAKEFESINSQEFILKKVSVTGGLINCIVISKGRKAEIPFKELALPSMGLSKMQKRLYEDGRLMSIIKDDICRYSVYIDKLKAVRSAIERDLEFHNTLRGMGQDGDIMYLSGYLPYDAESNLYNLSRQEKWGLMIKDPGQDDMVPTLIRNPRWVSIISPLFKVVEVIPGYRELDISMWFLVFFSIFFGMLIGDAGYGLVFFIITVIFNRKFAHKTNASLFILFYILSLCAIIWGVLTGTFFGQEWLTQAIKPLLPALREDKNVQAFCFLLGAVHLSIAHAWRAAVKAPSLSMLADIGWILILWSAFFLAKLLILAEVFPGFVKWMIIAGCALVILFSNPQKNILKSIASGLGNLLLNLINNFTDIVSYIRLFAVGLATVAVADSFNKMAMGIGFGSFLSGILTVLIILVGHVLNIVLGPMSILVHGVRLNVLEFCSHLDIKWSGFSYSPFREEPGILK
ncbi:MAG: hypothetical protein C4533_07380 [Candidatus Omnitrophota bacterium]|jgi:V/A-type H+-transporting ATPase subunit I|nr:MAG: hypothetical protein C4533_07380 [Candidatus Omnitrophota bacterium]